MSNCNCRTTTRTFGTQTVNDLTPSTVVISRSPSPSSNDRSRSPSPARRKRKFSKKACRHIMYTTSRALCHPKIRKRFARNIVNKRRRKNTKKKTVSK